MTQNIIAYADQVSTTRKVAEDLAVNLDGGSSAAELLGQVADALSEIDTNAKKLDDIASGLNTVLKLVGKIGPMKLVTTPLKKAISAIEARAEEVRSATQKLDSKFDKYGDVLDGAEKILAAASKVMDASAAHLKNSESGLSDTAKLVGTGHTPAHSGVAIAAADASASQALAQAEQIKQMILSLSPKAQALASLLESVDGAGTLVISANSKLATIIKQLKPIEGPLEKIANAVKPVEGFLDAADAVFNFFVSPILDPILKATGVNTLISNFVKKLDLPSVTPFNEIQQKIDQIGSALSDTSGDRAALKDGVAQTAQQIDEFLANGQWAPATDGNDYLGGNDGMSNGADALHGLGGHDFLAGGAGNDQIDGGSGFDLASFAADVSVVRVTKTTGSITVNATSAGLGTDLITGVERLAFNDGVLAFDTSGAAGQTYHLYQAAFDRTPDTAGLGHNIELMDQGLSLHDMAWAFVNSAEFVNLYGENASDNVFIEALYNKVLDRGSDAVGYAYWQSELASGSRDRVDVLIGSSESGENQQNVAAVIDDGIWYA